MNKPDNKGVEAYVLRKEEGVIRTTMRSSHGSWFIGTLLAGDVFYHYPADNNTRQRGYAWIYSPEKNGALGGFGWSLLTKIRRQKGDPKIPAFDNSLIQRLRDPLSLRSRTFINKHADHPYPPEGSGGPTGKVTIEKGSIPFYANQKGGMPKDLHPQKPFLTADDKVKLRYIVRNTQKRLIVVDFIRQGSDTPGAGFGIWGFLFQQNDGNGGKNFTYKM